MSYDYPKDTYILEVGEIKHTAEGIEAGVTVNGVLCFVARDDNTGGGVYVLPADQD